MRVEPDVKQMIERIAAQKNKTVSALLLLLVREEGERMRQAGWRVKDLPQPRDARRKLGAARYHEAWMLSTVRKAVRELNEAEVRAAIAEVDEAKKTGENVYLKTGLLKARKRLAEANGTSTPPPSDEQGLAGSAPGI